MLDKNSKIFLAGHKGMIGSAIYRKLKNLKYKKIYTIEKKKLDLRNQEKVYRYLKKIKPQGVIIAAAKVGGIKVNNELRGNFIFDDLSIQNNIIDGSSITVTGKTLEENVLKYKETNSDIIFPISKPFQKNSHIKILKGNLAPGSAIIKQSAASKELLAHEGVVEVFENLEDLANRIDSDDLNVTKDSILLLKNIGPIGAPGMPEAGLIPIPKKLAKQVVKDMVRISDGRMSGTAAGTIILHVCPEAAAGGTLDIVKSGDIIKLDVKQRLLELRLSDEEIATRKKNKKNSTEIKRRGYDKIFHENVLQADKGADFDFLRPAK